MIPSGFYNYLSKLAPLTTPALNLWLMKITESRQYLKNEVIYAKDKIPNQLTYLEEGNAIALSSAKTKTQILRFWVSQELICPPGFFHQAPNNNSIIALDDCLVTTLSNHKLQSLLANCPEAYKIINALLAKEIDAVKLAIKNFSQYKSILAHEAFLSALSISFKE